MVTINIRGKNLGQVKEELKRKLEADYYYRATVELFLIDRTKSVGKVIFFGKGGVHGVVQLLPGRETLLSEAIVHLHPTRFANLKKVKVNRIDPETQKTEEIIVNVDAVLYKGDRSKDLILQDGDRVEVPDRGIVF